jgi:hypothetical protein
VKLAEGFVFVVERDDDAEIRPGRLLPLLGLLLLPLVLIDSLLLPVLM